MLTEQTLQFQRPGFFWGGVNDWVVLLKLHYDQVGLIIHLSDPSAHHQAVHWWQVCGVQHDRVDRHSQPSEYRRRAKPSSTFWRGSASFGLDNMDPDVCRSHSQTLALCFKVTVAIVFNVCIFTWNWVVDSKYLRDDPYLVMWASILTAVLRLCWLETSQGASHGAHVFIFHCYHRRPPSLLLQISDLIFHSIHESVKLLKWEPLAGQDSILMTYI